MLSPGEMVSFLMGRTGVESWRVLVGGGGPAANGSHGNLLNPPVVECNLRRSDGAYPMSAVGKPLCFQMVVLRFSWLCEELLSDMPEGEVVGTSGIEAHGLGDRVGARGLAQIVPSVHLVGVPAASRDKFLVEVGTNQPLFVYRR